jgi:hypothetical protein
MAGKLSVAASSSKLSVAGSGQGGRKRCSVACSGSEDSVYEYEGPEFIIHKEDFLIHNKKVNTTLLPSPSPHSLY